MISFGRSSSSGLVIPKEYAYVVGSIIPTIWLLAGQTITVENFRTRAGIKYPQMYAERKEAEASRDAHLFNCAQRAHQNTLEVIPIAWGTTLVAGIHYPVIAASNLLLWTFGRILYTRGYISGDPAKRTSPFSVAASVGFVGLLVTSSLKYGKLVWKAITGATA